MIQAVDISLGLNGESIDLGWKLVDDADPSFSVTFHRLLRSGATQDDINAILSLSIQAQINLHSLKNVYDGQVVSLNDSGQVTMTPVVVSSPPIQVNPG